MITTDKIIYIICIAHDFSKNINPKSSKVTICIQPEFKTRNVAFFVETVLFKIENTERPP